MDPNDLAAQVVGYVCANQAVVVTLLVMGWGHFGFSVVSAVLKKLGVTPDEFGPILGMLIKGIRFAAVDLKPTPTVILKDAASIQQKG